MAGVVGDGRARCRALLLPLELGDHRGRHRIAERHEPLA
jgi:hypothetical protein